MDVIKNTMWKTQHKYMSTSNAVQTLYSTKAYKIKIWPIVLFFLTKNNKKPIVLMQTMIAI